MTAVQWVGFGVVLTCALVAFAGLVVIAVAATGVAS